MAPDLFVFVLAFSTYFGVERRFYQLAHNGVVATPAGQIVRKYGTVAADPKNAELALESGAAVLVYPGGDHEVFRPSWESDKVDFGGRKGFIRLALKLGVPIQPVVSIGSQETALFLTRGERLARLARLDKLMRLKTAPFMLGLPFGRTLNRPRCSTPVTLVHTMSQQSSYSTISTRPPTLAEPTLTRIS